jgi:WD40 repeat protein
MTAEEAERAGELALRGRKEQQAQSCYYVRHELPDGAIQLLIKYGKVAAVSVFGSAFATVSGVYVGDPESKVRARYGDSLAEFVSQSPDWPSALVYVPRDVRDRRFRLIFTVGPDVWAMHAASLPEGKHLLEGGIDDGCRDHFGGAAPLRTVSTRPLPEGVLAARAFVLSPDARFAVVLPKDSDPSQRLIQLWSLADGRAIAEWPAHAARIEVLAVSPDGSAVASAAADGAVAVWKLPAGQRVFSANQSGKARSLDFDRTGNLLAAAGERRATVWHVPSGRKVLDTSAAAEVVAISPGGDLIASPTAVVDVATGRTVHRISLDGHPLCMGFSPDGRFFALCQWDRIDLWETTTWSLAWSFWRHSKHTAFSTLAFDPSGRFLATAQRDTLWVLDIRTGEPVAYARAAGDEEIGSLMFLPSSREIVGIVNGRSLRRWSTPMLLR